MISYSDADNEIICATEDIKFAFALSPYYKDCSIDRIGLLENGIIKFRVGKRECYFEDYISIKDSIYGEGGNKDAYIDYQEDGLFHIRNSKSTIKTLNSKLLKEEDMKQHINILLNQFYKERILMEGYLPLYETFKYNIYYKDCNEFYLIYLRSKDDEDFYTVLKIEDGKTEITESNISDYENNSLVEQNIRMILTALRELEETTDKDAHINANSI